MSEPDDSLFSYAPADPDANESKVEKGKCPNCGAEFTVIPGLELIYQEKEAPLPEGHEVRPPDYCICVCGCHLWLVPTKTYRVMTLGPIPDPESLQ